MFTKDDVIHWIEENRARFCALADALWENPELSYYEFASSKRQADFLEGEGFRITWDIAGMNTAFCAEWGEGEPVIGVAGEYDALRGLSQKRQAAPEPDVEGGAGHACGHNLLGTGGLAAALALKTFLQANRLACVVRYYGCPAEEDGGGKTFMARNGVFDDLDAAFNFHPFYVNFPSKGSVIGSRDVKFRFHGVSSHAGAAPHLGRAALDAVELMNVGVNYLREHVPADVRMHYVITHGGQAPNIVPHEAEVWYYIRAYQPETLDDVAARVEKIAQGAALMTETTLEVIFNAAMTCMLNNTCLADMQYENMQKIGAIHFNEEEIAFAEKINAMYPPETQSSLAAAYHIPFNNIRGKALVGDNFAAFDEGKVMSFSTDVGDLSWKAPLSILYTACFPTSASLHTWGAAAAAGTSIGHKGMLHAAKIMALTAIDLFTDKQRLACVRSEFVAALAEHPYRSPVPESVQPPQIYNPTRGVG